MTKPLFSRRAFLKSGGALALSTPVLAGGAFAAPSPKTKAQKTCVVIGAGLSGLTAAYRLQRSGWRVTVIEARPRIGGRVWTHRDSQTGLSFELGGEWIGDDHARMIALCRHFGLPLQRHRFCDPLLQNGKVPRAADWEYSQSAQRAWKKFGAAWPQYSERDRRNLDRYDWWTWLARIGYSENDLRLRDLADSADFGESIRQVSAFAAASEYLESNATNEMDWKISGGNDRLPRALASRIGHHNFRTATTVSAVTQKNGKVYVRAGNEVLVADACICTVPARVLNHIRFSPELPDAQVKAAWELQYARIVKSAVTFDKRFWKGDDFSLASNATSHYYFHSTQKQSGTAGVLTSYAVGDKADVLASQSARRRQQIITRDLEMFDERAPRFARGIVSQAWQRDPFSQGAYALYRPGQWFSVRLILRKPHGKVFFAGEHLADRQGSMEGAVETGEAAADALLGK
jgi:monoamine oxidase